MAATIENGCIQIAPGSHRLEAQDDAAFNARHEDAYQKERFDLPLRFLEMRAGDSVIWNMKTLHSSASNHSDKSRWALAVHCITTEAAQALIKEHPQAGPHDIIAGRHDAQIAEQVRCMHCDRDAFARWGAAPKGYQ